MGTSGTEEMERLLNLVAPMPSAKSTSPKTGKNPATPSPEGEPPEKLLRAFDEMISTYGALMLIETIGVGGPIKGTITQIGTRKMGEAARSFVSAMLEWAGIDIMEMMEEHAHVGGR